MTTKTLNAAAPEDAREEGLFYALFAPQDEDLQPDVIYTGGEIKAMVRDVRAIAKNPATVPGRYVIFDPYGVACSGVHACDYETTVYEFRPAAHGKGTWFKESAVESARASGRLPRRDGTLKGGFYTPFRHVGGENPVDVYRELIDAGLQGYDEVAVGTATRRKVYGSNLSWVR